MMDALFASGRIIDLILLGVAAEALLLLALRRRLGGGKAVIANLASGAALMLALRAGLTGAGWPVVAGCLLAGLAAHLADLRLRLRADASPHRERGRNIAFRSAFTRSDDLKQV